VHWEGLGAEQRSATEQLMSAALTTKIAEVALEPLRPGEGDDYTLDGVRYRLNAEPAAVMELRPDRWNDAPAAMSFIVGRRGGSFKIATAAPASPAAAVAKAAVSAARTAPPARAPVPRRAPEPEAAAVAEREAAPLPAAVERDCANEIGLLCNERRDDAARVLACLKSFAESARKACRRALEAP